MWLSERYLWQTVEHDKERVFGDINSQEVHTIKLYSPCGRTISSVSVDVSGSEVFVDPVGKTSSAWLLEVYPQKSDTNVDNSRTKKVLVTAVAESC
jgi:hypothetical protein